MTKVARWTEQELADHNTKAAATAEKARVTVVDAKPLTPVQRFQALGRLKQGVTNKTEAAYGEMLENLKRLGVIVWYKFEGLKFRLADNTFYTPDFAVMVAGGALEAHEVKGFWTEDARVKIKVAADMYPIQFIAVKVVSKKLGGGWSKEEF